jgi:hypothetical protein
MADLETPLRALVLQNADVVTAIGQRFYWRYIPEETSAPYVKAQTITNPLERTHVGTYGGRERVQLDVYDDREQEARCHAAADTLATWLDNYNGAMGTYNVTIQVKSDVPFPEPDTRLFRRLMEIEVLYFNQV